MITDFLLLILYYLSYGLSLPLRLFSDVSLPADLTNALTTSRTYIENLNQVIPISNILTVLGLFITIEIGIFTYKTFAWVIKKLPGIN